MEPNEIVRTLRNRSDAYREKTRMDRDTVFDTAADCIERLQAENESLAINGGKYIEISQKRYEMYEAAIKRAEDAECKLSESQRRERAAVEILNSIDWVGSGAKGRIEDAIGILHGSEQEGE